jgi:hypothetical protein
MAYNGYIAPFVAGRGGLNGAENKELIPYSDLIIAKNIRYDGDAWRKAGGMVPFDANAVPNATCIAGIDFHINASAQKQVTAWQRTVNANTVYTVYKEVGGDVDNVMLLNVTDALTEPIVFVECGQEYVNNAKKLLMFCKNVVPYCLTGDGTTMNALTNVQCSVDWSSTDQPAAGIVHDHRVYAWGNKNAPHAIYVSNLDDHTNFYAETGNTGYPPPTFDVVPGKGDGIVACHSIGTTRLFVFKAPVGIYYLDTDNITSYYLPTTTVREDIGMAGPLGITKVGSLGTWFIGSDAHIYSLESISNPDVDLKDASITGQMNMTQWLEENVNPTYLKHAKLIYNPKRKEVLAYYTGGSGTINNIGLVIDVRNPQMPRIATEERGTYFQAAWNYRPIAQNVYSLVLSGGSDGYVYKLDQDSRIRVNTTTGYGASLRTPDTDFSWVSPELENRDKRFDYFEVVMTSKGAHNLYITLYIDGEYHSGPYAVDCGGTGGLLAGGSAMTNTIVTTGYGLTPVTTKTAFTFAASGLIRRKIKIGGIGRRLGFMLHNNEATQDFDIAKVLVSFQVLGTGGEVSASASATS